MVDDARRAALRAGGTALAAGLAGCTSALPGGGSGGRRGNGTGGDGLQLETLAVGGSPGGSMPVLPAGEVALLDFWATWCAPCKPQMAELRRVREQFPELHMLSITNETDTVAIRSFWREYEGAWPVASDPELETNVELGVTRIPTLLVFDAEGAEVWRHVGLAAAETIAGALREAGA